MTQTADDTPMTEAAGLLGRALTRVLEKDVPSLRIKDDVERSAVLPAKDMILVEFVLRNGAQIYRLCLHSQSSNKDKGGNGSRIGYGVLGRIKSDNHYHRRLTNYLAESSLGESESTDKIWAWYRLPNDPFFDLAQEETVNAIHQLFKSGELADHSSIRQLVKDFQVLAKRLAECPPA